MDDSTRARHKQVQIASSGMGGLAMAMHHAEQANAVTAPDRTATRKDEDE